jgi:hypothetical protein
MKSGRQNDIVGRIIGMLVFFAGIGLLALVFYHAYQLFTAPPGQALGLTFTGDPKKDPPAMQIGVVFATLLLRIGYMAVMCLVASLVANKGVQLYFSALHGVPVTITTRSEAAPPANSLPAQE